MSVTAICNAQLVLESGILFDGAMLIEDGVITAFGKERQLQIPADAQRIDAGGSYVGPGFVDIHVHGGPYIYKGKKFCCLKCMQEYKKRDRYRYYRSYK